MPNDALSLRIPKDENRQTMFATISDWLNYWFDEPRLPHDEQRVFSRYYHSFLNHFGPYLRSHYCSQTQELEALIVRRPECHVLEIGCGCGTESLWMGLLGAKVLGIDLREDRLRVANARLEHTVSKLGQKVEVAFSNISAFDAIKDQKYDIIWMEQAFHHVEPREEFVKLLAKALKIGGFLVISEANAWNPLLQLQLLFKRGFQTIKEFKDKEGVTHVYGNERILTPGSLKKLLERVGFSASSIRYFRIFPNFGLADRLGVIERVVPQWFKPAFTHFNLTAEYRGL